MITNKALFEPSRQGAAYVCRSCIRRSLHRGSILGQAQQDADAQTPGRIPNPFTKSRAKAKEASQPAERRHQRHQGLFSSPHEQSDGFPPTRASSEDVAESSAGRPNDGEEFLLTLRDALTGVPPPKKKSKTEKVSELQITKKLQAEVSRAEKALLKAKRAQFLDINSHAGGKFALRSLRQEVSRKRGKSGEQKPPKAVTVDHHEKSGEQKPLKTDPVDRHATNVRLLPKSLVIEPLDVPQPPVPYLSYGLDRVLFNPGVYSLQDPTSRVYNFDPYLEKIMPVHEFDFQALKQYKTSSQDTALAGLAQTYGKKYIGSTSSMTSTLAQFHFCLSRERTINTDMMSKGFGVKGTTTSNKFTKINKAPAAIFLRYNNGCYAIDVDKEYDNANVLMLLGKSLELLLTLPKSQYEIYRKSDPRTFSEAQKAEPESYQYTTMGDFLMRSQLDAYDHRLPGNGTFDLKTRAVFPIRMQSQEYLKMVDYEIQSLDGTYKSYEREKYDMMRATMLKYMLQVRMGRMTGIFVAYHNVRRMFGFEYIPLREMDNALHGTENPCLGDQEFKASLDLLNIVLDKATTKFPKTSLRLHFEAKEEQNLSPGGTSLLNIFAEPMTEEQVDAFQSRNKAAVAEAERIMMEGLDLADEETIQEDQTSIEDESTATDPAAHIDSFKEEESVEDSAKSALENEEDTATSASDAEEESSLNARDVSDSGELSATSVSDSDQEESLLDEEDLDDHDSSAETALASEAENDETSVDESSPESALTSEVDVDETSTDESSAESALTSEAQDDETSEVKVDDETSEVEVDEASKDESASEAALASEAGHGETSTNEAGLSTSSGSQQPQSLLHMEIRIRNLVNGLPVIRPENLRESDEWRIDYSITESTNARRAQVQYGEMKARRRLILTREIDDADLADGEVSKLKPVKKFDEAYIQMMSSLVRQGREYRAALDERDAGKEKVLYETFGPGVIEKVDGVDSYMSWLYTGKTAPPPPPEKKAPFEAVNSVRSYMDWLYGQR